MKQIILPIILLLLPAMAQAQVLNLSKKKGTEEILNTPVIGNYSLSDTDYRYSLPLKDGYPDEESAWIVYSDRDNNTTYQKPSHDPQSLTSLSFMQACYVIGKNGDYLNLVEYVPGVNITKNKKVLENPKYLGWVHKDNLLLWNKALRDKKSNAYLKSITAYGSERTFGILQNQVSGDSIRMFSNHSLSKPVGSCSAESIFYIYKQSPDGTEYLIGPDPFFLPENSAKAGLGWVSRELVRVWGTRGFVTLQPDLEASIPFYAFRPMIKDGNIRQAPVLVESAPSLQPKSNLQRLYPIVDYSTLANGDAVVKTGVLQEVLDKKGARIFNVSGQEINNDDVLQFKQKSRKLNIIFVIAGGIKNYSYLGALQQALTTENWYKAAKSGFSEVSMGALMYDGYGNDCSNSFTPLAVDNIAQIDAFVNQIRSERKQGCEMGNFRQALFKGIEDACKMLASHRGESNIIVVYGSGGDEDHNSIGPALMGVQNVGARLFFFQTHNIDGFPAYSAFVGQAKELISKSAENITTLKKNIVVQGTYDRVIPDYVGYTEGTDSSGRLMYLDYPNKAITQGYIVFPKSQENMESHYLPAYLDSLITSIAIDNRAINTGLATAIAQSGSGNTAVKSQFAYRFPSYADNIPAGVLKGNTLSNQNFMIPLWALISGTTQNTQTGLGSGLLLTAKEFNEVTDQLYKLGNASVSSSKENMVKHIENVVSATVSANSLSLNKEIKNLTFSEAMGVITGYFPTDALWMSTTLSQFLANKKLSPDIAASFIQQSKQHAVWLRDHSNNAGIQLINNGKTYYLLDGQHLPLNSVLKEGPAAAAMTIPVASLPVAGAKAASSSGADAVDPSVGNTMSKPVQQQIPVQEPGTGNNDVTMDDMTKDLQAISNGKNTGTLKPAKAPGNDKTAADYREHPKPSANDKPRETERNNDDGTPAKNEAGAGATVAEHDSSASKPVNFEKDLAGVKLDDTRNRSVEKKDTATPRNNYREHLGKSTRTSAENGKASPTDYRPDPAGYKAGEKDAAASGNIQPVTSSQDKIKEEKAYDYKEDIKGVKLDEAPGGSKKADKNSPTSSRDKIKKEEETRNYKEDIKEISLDEAPAGNKKPDNDKPVKSSRDKIKKEEKTYDYKNDIQGVKLDEAPADNKMPVSIPADTANYRSQISED